MHLELPNNIESEVKVLSSIIEDKEQRENISSLLTSDCFYIDRHKEIYNTIFKLEKENRPINAITLYEQLNDDYVIQLIDNHTSSQDAGYHSKVVYEKYLSRELISKCSEIIKKAGKEDIFNLIAESESMISQIAGKTNVKVEQTFYERIGDIFKDLRERKKGNANSETLVLNSLPSLNKIIGGIMPTDLIGIYGKEKSTKTSLAHEIVLNLGVDQKLPVGVFTFENSRLETDWKSISMRTGIEFNKLRNPKGFDSSSELRDDEIDRLEQNVKEKFSGSKLLFCDQILDEYQIGNKIRDWKKKFGVRLVVIDYLMLVNSIQKFAQRRDELNHISSYFKRLAMKLKVPIVLISQSNEAGERAAEAKGLERDSNYFIYVQAGEPKKIIKFGGAMGGYNYEVQENDYIVTVRGVRHAVGNRTFITRFADNRYVEVDTMGNYD